MKNMDNGLTAPRIYLPNLSARAQKFWISMKKGFIERPSSVTKTVACFHVLFHATERTTKFVFPALHFSNSSWSDVVIAD